MHGPLNVKLSKQFSMAHCPFILKVKQSKLQISHLWMFIADLSFQELDVVKSHTSSL